MDSKKSGFSITGEKYFAILFFRIRGVCGEAGTAPGIDIHLPKTFLSSSVVRFTGSFLMAASSFAR